MERERESALNAKMARANIKAIGNSDTCAPMNFTGACVARYTKRRELYFLPLVAGECVYLHFENAREKSA